MLPPAFLVVGSEDSIVVGKKVAQNVQVVNDGAACLECFLRLLGRTSENRGSCNRTVLKAWLGDNAGNYGLFDADELPLPG